MAETAFDTATRIAAGDDKTRYDSVAIALHWITAALVFYQFFSAILWDDLPRDTRETLESLHVSLGVALAAVIVARLIWRWVPGHQMSSLESGWMKLASKGTHYLLYGLLVAQVVLGFLFRWAQGHPVSFFGLPIPSPFGQIDKPMRRQIHALHEWGGWAIVILALLHAAAALYHHYVLKDRVLKRMLPGRA